MDSTEDILEKIVNFIIAQNPTTLTAETLPRDKSLLDLGIIDSSAFIELLVFAETTWDIQISDEDITQEHMGSVDRIVNLIARYIAKA